MILKKKIPRDFYKLFRTQNMEYYMQLLTALYEADQEAYALTQLTDSECRSILAETIARVNLVWWEDETEKTEDEGFPGLSPSAVLDRFVKWGWLSKDFDEKLNCYIIGFPEYSRLYVELFDRLEKEDDSMERESILSVYSALYTYDSDPEKNNSILKSALRTSKSLGQMLSNMQDSMRLWFDELSKRKDFIGIQEVLVNEINNRESVKYAILTTTDSFYRYKEAVKELIAKILEENENRREGLTAQKRMLMAAQGSTPEPSESAGGSYAASMQAKALASGASAPALLRLERGIQFCEEAAQLVLLVEREFDLIEKKYNRLIELKTVFARRALARIHYLLQEGAGVEDSTLELIGLLNHGDKKRSAFGRAAGQHVCDGTVFHCRGREPLQPSAKAGKSVRTAGSAGGGVLGNRRFRPEAALYRQTAGGVQTAAYEERSFSGFGGYGAVGRGSGKAFVYLAGGDPEQTGGRPDFAAGGNPSEGRLFLHRF